MTFQDAKDLAIEFGAKLPKFDHTCCLAQCWIDRVAMFPMIANRPGSDISLYIADANRYAG